MTDPNSIIIIGAGSAGLAAGHELHQVYPNANLTIFEAGCDYGGRVRQNTDWAGYPIEEGAEFLHNYNTWYGEQLRGMDDLEILDYLDKDVYYQHPETSELTAYTGSLFEERYNNHSASLYGFYQQKLADPSVSDMSIAQVLQNNFAEVDQNTEYLYEAYVGAIQGSSNNNISAYNLMKVYSEYEPYYVPGDYNETKNSINYQLKGKTKYEILGELFGDILPFIKYNTPVKKIQYDSDQVVVTAKNGQKYNADKVVICVPISQLKNNKILFKPALPQAKLDAINAIQMDTGVKLHLKFSEKFWTDEQFAFIIKEKISFFWDSSSARSDSDYVLGVLFFGQNAIDFQNAENQGEQTLITEALTTLGLTFNRNVSELFVDYIYLNWGEEQYIEGAYSFASLDEGNARQVLREPVNNKLFFAGEHTNPFDYATVHGAIESGFYAVGEITGNHKYQYVPPSDGEL